MQRKAQRQKKGWKFLLTAFATLFFSIASIPAEAGVWLHFPLWESGVITNNAYKAYKTNVFCSSSYSQAGGGYTVALYFYPKDGDANNAYKVIYNGVGSPELDTDDTTYHHEIVGTSKSMQMISYTTSADIMANSNPSTKKGFVDWASTLGSASEIGNGVVGGRLEILFAYERKKDQDYDNTASLSHSIVGDAHGITESGTSPSCYVDIVIDDGTTKHYIPVQRSGFTNVY